MIPLRTATILESIVEQYVSRALPVPSESIVNTYELVVSSATIRNEMARLEKEGYITRPHPSAGSIPTDKGYRYYVESLRGIKLPLSEQRLVSHLFYQLGLEKDIGKWLSLATTLIARLAQNVAVVTKPRPVDCKFKHLELVVLQDSLVLIVLVLHGIRVKQQLTTFSQVISQPQLTVIANRLNANYSGLTCSQILAKAVKLSATEKQVTDCLIKMMQAEDEQDYEEPYLDGWHFMLNQPEFVQSHQMLALMELVEQRRLVKTILPRRLLGRRVQVIIGKENEAKVIQNYSLVINQYGLPNEAIGTITVLGPTRMPYARTIATVDYLSSVLSGLVAELYGKQANTN